MASSNGITKIWTGEIAAAMMIDEADRVVEVSVLCTSGNCTIKGAKTYFKNVPPSIVTLGPGQTFNLRAANQGAPLDGLTIEPIAGVTQIIMTQG